MAGTGVKSRRQMRRGRKKVGWKGRRGESGGPVGVVLSDALRMRCDMLLARASEVLASRRRESVHDFRVSARRLIAAMDIILAVIEHEPLRREHRRLRRTLKSLNALRDLEIQRLEAAKISRSHQVLAPLLASLRVHERQLGLEARRQIRKLDPAMLQQSIASAMELLRSLDASPPSASALGSAVHAARAIGFLTLLRNTARASSGDEQSLHRVRVALKKFRYTTEVLAPCLPSAVRKQIARIQQLQDVFGAVQDWVIVSACITTFLRRRGFARQASMLPILRDLQERRTMLVHSAVSSFGLVPTLWPANPGGGRG